jgi:hypothetical protein
LACWSKIDFRKCTSDVNLSTEKTFGYMALGLFHKNVEIFFGLNSEEKFFTRFFGEMKVGFGKNYGRESFSLFPRNFEGDCFTS